MLKDKIRDKLNDQLKHELESAYLYFAMAGYFEDINLKGFAHWMKHQANEELDHSTRIFDYMLDRGSKPQLAALEAPRQDWGSPLEAMTDAYDHECFVSKKIDECVSLTLKENDHFTNTFLQWFVSEQIEEEATADDLVQKLKLIGDSSGGLFLLDAELARRDSQGSSSESTGA